MKRLLAVLITITMLSNAPSFAQDEAKSDDTTQAQASAEAVNVTYDERVELAKQMHELRPVRDQVEGAINQYAQTRPPAERESFKTAMRNVFNVKALEKISVDAYAETFTVEELRAMVEYYSKPEARSASAKTAQYGAIVYPEIVRMLDRAAIRLRAGE